MSLRAFPANARENQHGAGISVCGEGNLRTGAPAAGYATALRTPAINGMQAQASSRKPHAIPRGKCLLAVRWVQPASPAASAIPGLYEDEPTELMAGSLPHDNERCPERGKRILRICRIINKIQHGKPQRFGATERRILA